MARPQNKPTNFLQTAMLMIAVFIAVQWFMGQKNQPQAQVFDGKALVTRADYLAALRKADAQGNEKTAQALQQDYNHLLQDDAQKKLITADQAEALEVEAAALVADADLKGGLFKDDTTKVRLGYQALAPYENRLRGKPAWTTPIPVTNRSIPSGTISPSELFSKITDTLSLRNKTDLIWGFIPGGYQLIDGLVHLTGANPDFSYAFAAFLLALVVRAAVYPLSQKQLMFSRQMTKLTPRILEIKNKFADDQPEQQRRTMELYREYGLNPFAGCLPALVQMPLFLSVYQCMVHYQFQFSKGHFLWINPATSAASHGFFAPDLGHQDVVLILIYGITMTISTLLTPVTDPTQLRQQRMMGVGMAILFTVFMFLGVVPVVSGFVLYWTFTNILATAQALRAYRLPIPELVRVNAPGGGLYPAKPKGRWMQMLEEAQKTAEEKRREEEEKRKEEEKRGEIEDGKSPNGSKNGSTIKPKAKDPATKNGKASNTQNPKKDSSKKNPPDDPQKYRPKKRN